MVMEYLDDSDLAEWLRQRGALPVEQAVEFVLQASEAIAKASPNKNQGHRVPLSAPAEHATSAAQAEHATSAAPAASSLPEQKANIFDDR
jgi:hypothetical protein